MNEYHCPYEDSACPKVEVLSQRMDDFEGRIYNIQRTLYVICGILIAELGVTIL